MYTTQTIKAKDGLQLYKHSWNVNHPRAKLIFLHGFTEHGLRYEHFAKRVNESNISMVAFDLRGHGKSEGVRAYVEDFNLYLEDLEVMIQEEQAVSIPTFLIGHSLGGLILINYAVQKKMNTIKGIISIGPGLLLPENATPTFQKTISILAMLFPKLPTKPVDVTYGFNDPQEMELFFNDPLVYRGRIKLGFGNQLLKATKKVQTRFKQLNVPCLLMHGAADKMASSEGVVLLHEQATSKDKTLILWEGLYHSLLHSPEKEKVTQTIVDWILKRV